MDRGADPGGDSTHVWDYRRLGPRSFGQKLVPHQAVKVALFQRPFPAWKQPRIEKITPLLLFQLLILWPFFTSYFCNYLKFEVSQLYKCYVHNRIELSLTTRDFQHMPALKWIEYRVRQYTFFFTSHGTYRVVRGEVKEKVTSERNYHSMKKHCLF